MQCDVRQSDAYKNQMDRLTRSVGQQKPNQFWLFRVDDPLESLNNIFKAHWKPYEPIM